MTSSGRYLHGSGSRALVRDLGRVFSGMAVPNR